MSIAPATPPTTSALGEFEVIYANLLHAFAYAVSSSAPAVVTLARVTKFSCLSRCARSKLEVEPSNLSCRVNVTLCRSAFLLPVRSSVARRSHLDREPHVSGLWRSHAIGRFCVHAIRRRVRNFLSFAAPVRSPYDCASISRVPRRALPDSRHREPTRAASFRSRTGRNV